MYRYQNHDFMFSCTEVMTRNATKSRILAAILIFIIWLLDIRTKIAFYTLTLKLVLKTKLLNKVEMKT